MSSQDKTLTWPTPRPGQAQVTLLGCPHFANPGNDAHNVAVDDTLAPGRQNELAAVAERLEQGAFDHVAVEIPRDRQSALDSQFAAGRDGAGIADEDQFPDGTARIRGEAVQIGFRLAASLGLSRVEAVDSRPDVPDIDADWEIDEDPDDVPYPLPDVEQVVRTEGERLRNSELHDVLRAWNRADRLQRLHAGNIAASFSSSDGRDYTGSRQVGFWYERNARIAENLRRVTGTEEETLFVVGGSHVIPVKQVLQADPRSCPRSALPLLD